VLETIRSVKLLSDPPPKTVLGLSNVSQGTRERRLLNRTYLVIYAPEQWGSLAAVLGPDLDDAARTQAVCFAADRSAESGKPVPISEFENLL